ncbi:MAG TPA: hypothetical protein VHA56_01155 [Mucilaginibacter sp.]|nr:hypothetical protein [Mucilaginibacter sp.]
MKIFIYILVGVVAIIITVVSIFNFNPETETWGSLLLGGMLGFTLYKAPSVIRNMKQRKGK